MRRSGAIGRHRCRGFSNGLLSVTVLFVLAAVAIAWVSLGIVTTDRWPIRWLEINGDFERVSAEQLRASLAPLISSSFFTMDLHRLRDAASRLSWVSSVRVQKRWPDTVAVLVEEYVPVAHWNRGRLISSRGIAFLVPEADGIQGLPWLEGPEERLEDVLSAWAGFNEQLMPTGLEIRRLKLDRRGSWSMELSSGTHVHLGRDDAPERMARLIRSWEPLLADGGSVPVEVDLRYTNGFAVLWPLAEGEQEGAGS